MRIVILQSVKATALTIIFATLVNAVYGQQHIIDKKDDTRPEVSAQQTVPARIYSFSAVPRQGYNEIQWSAVSEQDTRRFIVEFSSNGLDYQTAGEVSPFDGVYKLKHYTFDNSTFLYRIRMEKKDGRFFSTGYFLLGGVDARPVKLYPTIVEGGMINLQMDLPVHRINIISTDGKQVLQKDLGGNAGFTQVPIPSLSKGMYLVTFYGNGWQSMEKFMIGG